MSRNLRQLPERSRSALGGNVVLDDSYDYDANGNVAAISDGLAGGPGNRDMSYDALDRLAGVVAGPAQGGNGSFAYDPLDNLRVLDQGSRQFRYHYDASNRLAQITSPTGALLHSFGYDARGNTTSKDSGTLTFDRENRLTHSALPTATTYLYDGLGRRVAEASPVSTYFYYSHEGKLLYTNDHKTQANTDHIYLSGSLVAARKVAFTGGAQVTYQHTDALGSPVAFTDASGNVTRRERMTAWGEPADGTWSNEPGYTGHQMDAGSKLVYMQQRYYDPAIGRFLSIDPMPVSQQNGWNSSRYGYARNQPHRFVDPDGRAAISTNSGYCAMVRVCNYGERGRPGGREAPAVAGESGKRWSDDVEPSRKIRRKMKTSEDEGGRRMEITLTMSPGAGMDEATTHAYISTANSGWNQTILGSDGVSRTFVLNLSFVKKGGDLRLLHCTAKICGTPMLGAADLGGPNLYYSSQGYVDTPTHEFGQIFGLWNRRAGLGCIMCPDNPRSVTEGDFDLLWNEYHGK